MRVLILSCKTGGGHNAAGEAVREAFERRGDEAVFLEYLALSGSRVNDVVGNVYIWIAKNTPRLFGAIYRLGMWVGKRLHRLGVKSPVYYANALAAASLAQYLKSRPFDAILMPHLYPAETLTYIRRHLSKYGVRLPKTFAIGTDYTCIPFWEETQLDYYFIPHRDLRAEYIRRGVPADKLIASGIPVSLRYREEQDLTPVRAELKIEPGRECILVMGGSMGFGSVRRLVEVLQRRAGKYHVIVVCGTNRKLEKTLKARYVFAANITVLGYTKHIPELMQMSALIYTKAGGLTATEAAAARRPLVFIDSIPGCEDCNRAFFLVRGMGAFGRDAAEQAENGIRLLKSKSRCKAMTAAQEKHIDPLAAAEICRRVHEICSL